MLAEEVMRATQEGRSESQRSRMSPTGRASLAAVTIVRTVRARRAPLVLPTMLDKISDFYFG